MALKLPLKARGGFEAPEGYRRVAALNVEFLPRNVVTAVVDYKDAAVRAAEPNNIMGTADYRAQARAQPRHEEPVGRNPDGSLQLEWKDGAPGYDDLLARPIADYITITPETTTEDVLKAIAYGHLKATAPNQNAIDV